MEKGEDQPRFGDYRFTERVVLEVLEYGDFRFTDIKKMSGISKPALSRALKSLEEKGSIERYYEEGKILIRLSGVEATPVGKTLRHLKRMSNLDLLDLRSGRELFTKDIVEGLKELAQYELTTEHGAEIRELDETVLLKALSRYYTERYLIPQLFRDPDLFIERHPDLARHLDDLIFIEGGKIDLEDLKDFYEKNKETREILPALSIARKKHIGHGLEKIVNWIHPLLDPFQVLEKEGEEGTAGLVIRFTPNPAGSLFWSHIKSYLVALFAKWYSKIKDRSDMKSG